MTIKERIDSDLKTAMLSGDKELTTTLRGLKSSILYEEVSKGLRETGLDDEAVTILLSKESKKRQESADLYVQGGNQEKADFEIREKVIIEQYLPVQLSNDELASVVDDVLSSFDEVSNQQMGQVIGAVKAKVGSQADGSRIAHIVKEKMGN